MSNRPPYSKGDPRARAAGRKGGQVTALERRASKAPSRLDPIELMAQTPLWSRAGWRSFAKASAGLGHLMTAEELDLYRTHTRRERAPTEPVDEAVMMIGTSAGKTSFAAFRAVHAAITFDRSTVAEGELVTIPILAKSKDQARLALSYARGLCALPDVAPFVFRSTLKNAIEFRTGVTIEILAASFRGVRGYTNPCAVLDECAYWFDDGANPDVEIVNAIRTRLSRVPGSQLLILSSPHAPRGVLYDLHEAYFGNEEASERDRVLVWNASTLAMRPDHPKPHAIERAFRLDPVSAASEYGIDGFVQFRLHQQALFDLEPVTAAIVSGCQERPPVDGMRYVAFLDVSEGRRNGDAMTVAVAHAEGGRAVLDCLRIAEPPFNPADVLASVIAPTLHAYRLTTVTGDRVAVGFVEATLRACGIRFEVSPLDKSALYLQLLNMVNSGAVALLDDPTLRTQLLSLQRRSSGGGRDTVDHPRGAHDDLSNSAAGAAVLAMGVNGKRKRPIAFSGSERGDRQRDKHAEMMALIASTQARAEAEARRDAERARAAADAPMRRPAVWHVHGG